MSDKHSGYIVVLDTDVSEEYSAKIIDAIRMIKGVLDIEPVVTDFNTHAALVRASSKMRDKVLRLYEEI